MRVSTNAKVDRLAGVQPHLVEILHGGGPRLGAKTTRGTTRLVFRLVLRLVLRRVGVVHSAIRRGRRRRRGPLRSRTRPRSTPRRTSREREPSRRIPTSRDFRCRRRRRDPASRNLSSLWRNLSRGPPRTRRTVPRETRVGSRRRSTLAAWGCHLYALSDRRSNPATSSTRRRSNAARTTTREGAKTASGTANLASATRSIAGNRPRPNPAWSMRSVRTTSTGRSSMSSRRVVSIVASRSRTTSRENRPRASSKSRSPRYRKRFRSDAMTVDAPAAAAHIASVPAFPPERHNTRRFAQCLAAARAYASNRASSSNVASARFGAAATRRTVRERAADAKVSPRVSGSGDVRTRNDPHV